MSPILDSIGSVKGYGWGSLVEPETFGSFESISSLTLGSNQSNITFNNISQSYQHLQVRMFLKFPASGPENLDVTVNDITSSTYRMVYLYGNGSSASGTTYGTFTHLRPAFGLVPGSESSTFSNVIMDIHDYSTSGIYKTARTFGGYDSNGSGYINFNTGSPWATTAAITKLVFSHGSGNFSAGSKFALYGIKGVVE